jgi:hypothetical protein
VTIAALEASGFGSPDGLEYDIKSKVDELITAVNAIGEITGGVAGVAAGYKIARGETALDGSNPTPVATGLATVIAFVATLKGTATPGDSTSVLTANIAGAAGNVNVYAWKTDGADPTFIASTGTESFYWVAVGT